MSSPYNFKNAKHPLPKSAHQRRRDTAGDEPPLAFVSNASSSSTGDIFAVDPNLIRARSSLSTTASSRPGFPKTRDTTTATPISARRSAATTTPAPRAAPCNHGAVDEHENDNEMLEQGVTHLHTSRVEVTAAAAANATAYKRPRSSSQPRRRATLLSSEHHAPVSPAPPPPPPPPSPPPTTSHRAFLTPRATHPLFQPPPRFAATTRSNNSPHGASPATRPRYILPASSSAGANADTGLLGPAASSAPAPPALAPAALLSHAFSPHRRKDAARFVPGGLASTARGWIVDAAVGALPGLTAIGALQRGAAALGGEAPPDFLVTEAHVLRGMAAVRGEIVRGRGSAASRTAAVVVRVLLVDAEEGGRVESSLRGLGDVGAGEGTASVEMAALVRGRRVQLTGPMWEMQLPRDMVGQGAENGVPTTGAAAAQTARTTATTTTMTEAWIVCARWRVV